MPICPYGGKAGCVAADCVAFVVVPAALGGCVAVVTPANFVVALTSEGTAGSVLVAASFVLVTSVLLGSSGTTTTTLEDSNLFSSSCTCTTPGGMGGMLRERPGGGRAGLAWACGEVAVVGAAVSALAGAGSAASVSTPSVPNTKSKLSVLAAVLAAASPCSFEMSKKMKGVEGQP